MGGAEGVKQGRGTLIVFRAHGAGTETLKQGCTYGVGGRARQRSWRRTAGYRDTVSQPEGALLCAQHDPLGRRVPKEVQAVWQDPSASPNETRTEFSHARFLH